MVVKRIDRKRRETIIKISKNVTFFLYEKCHNHIGFTDSVKTGRVVIILPYLN